MIELSPKALRYARLAAETSVSARDEPRVAALKRTETEHLASVRSGSLEQSQYLSISEDLARFCLLGISSVLDKPTAHEDEWDENDLMFLKTVSTHLSRSLAVNLKVRSS